jgi:hypothetical protein
MGDHVAWVWGINDTTIAPRVISAEMGVEDMNNKTKLNRVQRFYAANWMRVAMWSAGLLGFTMRSKSSFTHGRYDVPRKGDERHMGSGQTGVTMGLFICQQGVYEVCK